MATGLPENKAYRAIIWIPVDERLQYIQDTKNTSMRIGSKDAKRSTPWFEKKNVSRLQDLLGMEYAYADSKIRILHQDVVTMEILRLHHTHDIVYANTLEETKRHLSALRDGHSSGVLVFLHYSQRVHPARFAKMYDKLTHEAEIYPSRDEMIWDESKIYDLRVLDEIARADGAYRPKTCYSMAGRPCPLVRKRITVLKRSHSCCGKHVLLIERRSGKLACRRIPPADQDEVDGTYGNDYYSWIHQEYVPSLVQWGELRVFLATRTRGSAREPYIVQVIRTVFEDSDNGEELTGEFYAENVSQSVRWPEYPHLTYDCVQHFALHMYRKLQATNAKGFDSLKVGARLDLGVSPDGKELFVNEITRWYGAHYFSGMTGSSDGICRAYAQAFAEVYPAATGESASKEDRDLETSQLKNGKMIIAGDHVSLCETRSKRKALRIDGLDCIHETRSKRRI